MVEEAKLAADRSAKADSYLTGLDNELAGLNQALVRAKEDPDARPNEREVDRRIKEVQAEIDRVETTGVVDVPEGSAAEEEAKAKAPPAKPRRSAQKTSKKAADKESSA